MAESAGLVELAAGSVRFRYPLIRAAVYHGTSDRIRRKAHLLLSEAIEGSRDPDLVAWHQGSAATGPDEKIAAELERAADRAQARGAMRPGLRCCAARSSSLPMTATGSAAS